jgi:hypothetical protein
MQGVMAEEQTYPIFTRSKVWDALEEKGIGLADPMANLKGVEDVMAQYVTRGEHFAIPTRDVDCDGCPKRSKGTYGEWANRCQEAARVVVRAKADLEEISQTCKPAAMSLADHPLTKKASDPKRMGQARMHRPVPDSITLKCSIEVVDHPSGDVPLEKEQLIEANNFGFNLINDPANEAPTRGRKKRARVEFNHTFDRQGGDGIGRHC